MKRKHYIWSAIVCAVALLAWAGSDEYLAREWATYQMTPDWQDWGKRIPPGQTVYSLETDSRIPIDIQPSILLRTDTSTKKLLLKHTYGIELFAFDPETRSVAPSTEGEWEKADGEIARCRSQFIASFRGDSAITFNPYPDYEARLNGKKLKTYGRFSQGFVESPTLSKVALLSAGGWLSGPGIGFVGLGGADPKIRGQRYLEIMDIHSGEYLTDPIRLVSPDFDGFNVCFSSDERFVVAYNPDYKNVSIVEVKRSGE